MKKVLVGVLVLVVLLAGGLLVAPSFVDWNAYRGEIAEQAKAHTGRTMDIGGDISLSLLPTPGLTVDDVRLANAPGAQAADFVRLKSLRVQVALAPLIRGEVQVTQIRLIDPVIELEMMADGRPNWELTPPEAAAEPTPSAPSDGAAGGEPSGAAPDVRLDSFVIENGVLVYRDAAAGTEERVEALNARIRAASLAGPFESAGSLIVRGLPLDYELSVGKLVEGRTLPASVALSTEPGKVSLRADGAVLDLEGQPRFKGKIKAEGRDLAAILGLAAGAETLPGFLGQAFSLEADAEAGAAGGSVKGLDLSLGETRATGSLEARLGDAMALTAQLDVNKVDLDAWMAMAPAKAGEAQPKAVATGGTGGDAKVTLPLLPRKDGAGAAGFSLPTNLEGSVRAAIGAVTYRGGVIGQVKADATLAGGEVTLSQFSAQMPGGSDVALFGFLSTPQGQPRFEGNLEARVGDLRGVLSWLDIPPPDLPADRLRRVNLKTALTATGEQVQATDLSLAFDSSRLTGGVVVALRARPSFGADLTLDKINLDGYLKPPAPAAGGGGGGSGGGGGAAKPAAASSGGGDNPLAALGGFDANLRAKAGSVVYRNQTIRDVNLDATLYNGDLTLRRASVDDLAGARVIVQGGLNGLTKTPVAKDLRFDATAQDLTGLFRLLGQTPPVPPATIGPVAAKGSVDGAFTDPRLNVSFSGAGVSGKVAGALQNLDGSILKGGPKAKDVTFDLASKDLTRALALAGVTLPMPPSALGAVTAKGRVDGSMLGLDLDLDLGAAGGTAKLAGTASLLTGPGFKGQVEARHDSLPALLKTLRVGYQPQGPLGGFQIKTPVAANLKSVVLAGLAATVNGVLINGTADVALDGPRPRLTAKLDTTDLVVDPFLPVKQSAALEPSWQSAVYRPGRDRVGPTRAAARAAAGGPPWTDDPIDLSGLRALDADVSLDSPSVTYQGYRLDQAQVRATLVEGLLTAQRLAGKMFGGTADITGTVDARGRVPAVDTTVKVAEVDLVQASQSTSGKTLASGRFSLDTRLTARGGSQADMVRTLGGDGRFDLRNVDVKSAATGTAAASLINLLASLNKLGGASKGASADIGGTYRIDRGILTTNDLALASGLGNGQAQGTVNLPAWTIDLDGRIKMSQSALTQILASKVREVRQVQDLPFSVKGPLDAPDVHVDTASLPSGGVAIPGLDKGLDKLRKKKGLGALIDQIAPQQQGTTTGSGGVPDPAPTVPVTRPRAGDTLAPPPPPSSGGGTAGQTQPAGKADVLQQVLPGLLNKLGK